MSRYAETSAAQTALYRLLDRLDTEDDDAIRGDLIIEVLALCDRHPEVRDEAVAYSDRFTYSPSEFDGGAK